MPPPVLPAHLSYKSALVLIPPKAIQDGIEAVRKQYDRNFHRWPPHINLIYPYLSSPSAQLAASSSLDSRLRSALQDIRPFSIHLKSTEHFAHSKSSATVWLSPDSNDGPIPSPAVVEMQATLQAEFAECDSDKRPFQPHLSLGQARGSQAAEGLKHKANLILAGRPDGSDMSEAPDGDSTIGGWRLDWLVDRVFVIERQGYKGRFKVVKEVMLNG